MNGEVAYRYLLVGAGMASDSAARGIRELDAAGTIGVLGAESDGPIDRPALSKYLWTDADYRLDQAWLTTAEDTGATLHLGDRAVALDPATRSVTTESGAVYRYERLLLATGGQPRRLDFPDDDRVIYFRSAEDYRRLRRQAGGNRRVAVIGGGFIGTEIAASLIQNETAVTLIHPDALLGGSVFPPALARYLDARFRRAGVELLGSSRAQRGFATGDDLLIEIAGGEVVTADAVVIGLGVTPAVDLATAAGLEVEDGVVVDRTLRTSDPAIWAAGDIAQYPDAILGRVRIEHVDGATAMGQQAGRNMAGADESYGHTPLFYSDLFSDGYEAVGRLDASLTMIEDWNTDAGADAPADEGPAPASPSGVVYYWSEADRAVSGVLLWNRDGGSDEAREVIAHPPADPHSLLGRIR